MQYNTQLPVQPAVSPALRQQGLAALSAPSPMAFPGAHADVYAGLAAQNATGFDRSAQQINADYMKQARDTQVQMALRGLDQMAQAQDSQRNLASQVNANNSGFLNSLLQGLYRT